MSKWLLFRFPITKGGIGDMIKYFIGVIDIAKSYDLSPCLIKDENIISKYIILKDNKMYKLTSFLKNFKHMDNIKSTDIDNIHIHASDKNSEFCFVADPNIFYERPIYNILEKYNLNDIFYFSNDVINLAKKTISDKDYISIHIRRGDKFIDTDPSFKYVLHDERPFNESRFYNLIEDTYKNYKNILFFCDSMSFKAKIQKKYPFLITTNFNIGHTSYKNTSEEQVLNTVCEFYIISQSKRIISNCKSGFSTVASMFNNVPITYYETDIVPNRY